MNTASAVGAFHLYATPIIEITMKACHHQKTWRFSFLSVHHRKPAVTSVARDIREVIGERVLMVAMSVCIQPSVKMVSITSPRKFRTIIIARMVKIIFLSNFAMMVRHRLNLKDYL